MSGPNQKRNYAKYYAEHKVELADARREYARRYKKLAYEILGWKCVRCGYSNWKALQVDHLKGNGNLERRSQGHETYKRYKNVMDRPWDYQLLCANCNQIKKLEHCEGHPVLDPLGQPVGDITKAGLNLEGLEKNINVCQLAGDPFSAMAMGGI